MNGVSVQMANSNKKQSGGLISNAFGVAKKLGETGFNMLNHVAPGTVSKLTQAPQQEQVVQGVATEKSALARKKYENPQQMMREHLPTVTGKLLGRNYQKINSVASFISPNLNDKLSDYLFDRLNDFVSELSSVDALLKEVGAKDLSELAKDPARSERISIALSNQNKIIAALQGGLTGVLGGMGALVDVPMSLALALRSVYQTGRAYGFELNPRDHDVVEYIFKQIDLGTVAEKQALLAAVRTFSSVLQTHDVGQLQQLLGSANDIDVLKRWVANDDGSFKLNWMNNLPQLGLLNKLTPLATLGISAVYSCKLVDDATNNARIVFSQAQQYKLQHPDETLDPLEAFEKAIQTVAQLSPSTLKNVDADVVDSDTLQAVQDKEVQVEASTKLKEEAEAKVESEPNVKEAKPVDLVEEKNTTQQDIAQESTQVKTEQSVEHQSPENNQAQLKNDNVQTENKTTVTKKAETEADTVSTEQKAPLNDENAKQSEQ